MIIAVVDDTMQDRELLKGVCLTNIFPGIRQYLRFKSLNPEKHF